MQSKLRQIAVKEDLAGEGRACQMFPATSATPNTHLEAWFLKLHGVL
jgi:hypothetical protein